MKSRSLPRAALAVTVAVIAFSAGSGPGALASGGFFPHALFTYRIHPDFPLERFAAGRLGLVEASLPRKYKVAVWRYLDGKRLTREEQQDLVSVARERLRLGPGDEPATGRSPRDVIAEWLKARAHVPGAPRVEALTSFRDLDHHAGFANCLDDAFVTATATLRERAARHGAASEEVRQWLLAQDQVFTDCGSGAAIPTELPASSPVAARADRAYQIASAHFYAMHYDRAAELFQAIGRDSSSPWARWGDYLAARALVRKAVLANDPSAAARARDFLHSLVAAPDREGSRTRAAHLLDYLAVRSDPQARLLDAAHHLARGATDFRNDLVDYGWLLDQAAGDAVEYVEDAPAVAARIHLDAARASDEMTDWLMTFRDASRDPADARVQPRNPLGHALERWNRTRSLPWLMASISLVSGEREEVPALLEAAAHVGDESPARTTLVFHSARLLLERAAPASAGAADRDRARALLDALLPALAKEPPSSTLNRFLALRSRLARDQEEFVRFAPRWLLGPTTYPEMEVPDALYDGKKAPSPFLRFDDESAGLARERLPLSLLASLGAAGTLGSVVVGSVAGTGAASAAGAVAGAVGAGLRDELVRAAWVRAVLLDDEAVGRRLIAPLRAQHLETRGWPGWKDALERYEGAPTVEERRFAAVYAMLQMAGLRPWVDAGLERETPLGKVDTFRDNWWCDPAKNQFRGSAGFPDEEPPRPDELRFLDDAARAAAASEWTRLGGLGTGAAYLAEQVLAFAKLHPDDARLPEALFLVNRATHFSCADERTSAMSKKAYLFMHKTFPHSAWTAKVKFWW